MNRNDAPSRTNQLAPVQPYTPGPWIAATEPSSSNGDWAVRGEVGRHRLALVYVRPGEPGASAPETEANARLIAAAPRLLAALSALVVIHDDEFGTIAPEMDEALAAISQATGLGDSRKDGASQQSPNPNQGSEE